MITIISSTNRPGSRTREVAMYYQRCLALEGRGDANLIDLGTLPDNLSAIVFDDSAKSDGAFAGFQQLVHDTDYFIFVVPEYNGSIPGILKLFLDACEFPESFKGKKAALVGLSSGQFGNLRGLDHLDAILNYLQVETIAYRVHLPRVEEMFQGDDFVSEEGKAEMLTQIRGLGLPASPSGSGRFLSP